MMSRIIIAAVVVISCFPCPGAACEIQDLDRWLQHGEALVKAADSYTSLFHKQERINARLTDEETIYLKFKKPFKVYMKWIQGPYQGRESLYVEGCNGNRIKIRESGLAGMLTLNLDPQGPLIMGGSRHPVTDAGIEQLVRRIRENLKKGMRAGEVEGRSHGKEVLYGQQTQKVEIIFPADQKRGYYCYRAVLNIDVVTKLPVRVKIYDWVDELVESYGYEAVRLDAGLSDTDFDAGNSACRL